MNIKTPKYEIYAYAYGVKKRGRKSEKHQIKCGEIEINQVTDEKFVFNLVKNNVVNFMKTLDNKLVDVRLNYIELENEGTFTIKHWQMFDKRNIQKTLNIQE